MSTVYELGPFRLDAEAAVLTYAGVPMALGSRGVAVLRTLVERPHEYVAKGSIIDAAWPGVVVEESNLAVQISAIRRVLARAAGGEHWIETLARRGYRFVGPVAVIRNYKEQESGAQRSNLPQPLTSFIGRERELVEIKRLLPGKRLLTLVGVGGIGKTRLTLQVAAEVADAYRDGVWFVEFGCIRDPLLVPTSVAQVLAVQERAGVSLAETLCTYLKGRQSLLILDNCEHVLDACARLAGTVLRSATEVTIIATSREPLQVAGEQTYPVQPLALPEPTASAEAMWDSEAVHLFVERVRRQLPDFEPTPARAPIVAELCIHLDGIPLALELAAARTRSLSVEQINSRLHDRFKLLTGGNRMALPRQQTLRAMLDWSHDLLAEDERVVLRRLAIFPGSFTLEAAAAVVADAAIDEFAVIDLLSQLVARSLVIADTTDRGARYRLLETTRAYSLEKLVEAEDIDAIRRRHARHFRDLFEHASDDWLRMSDADWRVIYPGELDNVRAALDWASADSGDSAIGTALAGASGPIWLELSLAGEGRRRLEAAIARMESHVPELDQGRIWLWLGWLRFGAPVEAVAALEQAIERYRRLTDPSALGLLLGWLGRVSVFMGRFEQAAAAFAEALPLLEKAGLPKALGSHFEGFGFLKLRTGDLDSARGYFESALALYRDAGAESSALTMLLNIADMTWALGDLDAALSTIVDAVARLRKSPLAKKHVLGNALTNLAGVHTERGEIIEALAAAREGLPLRKDAGYGWVALDHLGVRAVLAGHSENAARLAGYADWTYTAKKSSRQPNEARARERLRALLRAKLVPNELERLLAEGAAMSEDEAVRLALEE